MIIKRLVLITLSAIMVSGYHSIQADSNGSSVLASAGSMAAKASFALATVAAGTTLALGAHIATEYPIVYLHEYGHAITRGLPKDAITIECKLKDHPLAVLVPFMGLTKGFGGGRLGSCSDTVATAAGPIVGLCAAYGSILLAHTALSVATGGTVREGFHNGYTLPLRIYKDFAIGISEAITQKSSYKLPSFLQLSTGIFTLLKAGKICGEFLYGLTPISTYNGDGHQMWQNLGLKRNLTVEPFVGLGLALTPTFAAIGYGICKGIYNHL